MSYARFGANGSDVYVYLGIYGLECCGCWLQKREWVEEPDAFFGGYLKAIEPIVPSTFETTEEMLAHLEEHRKAGHTVTDETIQDLKDDAEENDRYIQELLAKGAQ